jgi:hypothetical protein
LKRCSICKEWKDETEFGKVTRNRDGLRSNCKVCHRIQKRKTESEAAKFKQAKRLKAWMLANPDKVKEAKKRNAHTEKAKQARRVAKRLWKILNPLKVLEEKRRYNARYPEKKKQWQRSRRARIKGNGGEITAEEWQAVLDKYGHKCLYPNCERTDIEMDHVVPLAFGGTHTADNVQPLCVYHNRNKYTQTVDYRLERMF